MAEQKAKAPDNNKRLAALEAGVSALTMALTANGIELAVGDDPIEKAIGAIKRSAEEANDGALEQLKTTVKEQAESYAADVEKLNEQLHNLAGYASATLGRLVPELDLAPLTDEQPFAYLERLTAAANPAIENLLSRSSTPGTDAAELDAARKRIVELTAEIGELEQDLLDMTNAKNELANQLAAEGKGTGQAPPPPPPPDPEPENLIGDRDPRARDVGPGFSTLTEVAIGALVEEGGDFELAFSNGEFEIVELQPVKIRAKDLHRVDSSRWIVGPAVHVKGAVARVRLAGAGLLYKGEQVGYCAFDPALVVDPGQERRFDRCLIF
jgi:predicted  nucleic acid-binding Zn-ribbon protein